MTDYNLGTARGVIEIEYKGDGVKKAKTDLEKAKEQTEKNTAAASTLGKGMAGAGAAMSAGFAVAVKAAVGFENRMSAVKAVSGASGEEMKQLSDLALKLGASTKYNAEEAASAIEELVKAGVSVPDVMNGAAQATVNLAAAGEIDLPQAAAIASNAMNQFGLAAEKMPRIADMIAGAANASAIDVKDFGYSISQSGAVAATAGVSFDDLAVAIAEMGNAGIKGSDAGTSIKTFLTNLIPTTDKARGMFADLGLIATDTTGIMGKLAKYGIKPASDSWEDAEKAISKYIQASGQGEIGTAKNVKATNKMATELGILQNKFFDAEGNMKSFGEVQQILAESMKGMSKEDQLYNLTQLFGSDAVRAASVFAKNGAKGFNDVAEAMGKVTAEQVAQERQNNLAGQWEELTGSLETLAIEVGQILLPFLKELVSAVQAVIGVWQNLSPNTKKVLVIIGALVAIFLVLVGAVLTLIGPIMAVVGVFSAAGVAFLPIVGIIAAIIAGLILLGIAVVAVIKNWDKIKAFTIKVWNAIKGFFAGLWSGITDIFTKGVNAVKNFLTGTWGSIAEFFTDVWSGVAEFFRGVWDGIVGFFTGVWNRITGAVQAGLEFVKQIIMVQVAIIQGIWQAFWNVFGGLITAVWDLIRAAVDLGIKLALLPIRATMWAVQKAWEFAWNAISGAAVAAWTAIVGFVGPKVDWLRDKVVSGVTWIRDKVAGLLAKIGALFVTTWNKVVALHVAVFNQVVSAVTGFASRLWAPIQARLDAIRKKFSDTWASVTTTLRDAWGKMVSYASEKISELLAKVTGLEDRVVNAMRNAASWLKDAGRRIIQGLIDGVTDRIKRFTQVLRNLTNMIPDLKGPPKRDAELLYKNGELIMGGLIRAVEDRIPDFARLLSGFTSDIPGMASTGAVAAPVGPTTDARSYGATVHQDVKIYYPVAERDSKAVDRSLQLAGAFGEV